MSVVNGMELREQVLTKNILRQTCREGSGTAVGASVGRWEMVHNDVLSSSFC